MKSKKYKCDFKVEYNEYLLQMKKIVSKIVKHDLVILDNFGVHPIDIVISMILLETQVEKYDIKSIIIASQNPDETWFHLIPDKTHANAICDRLIHNFTSLELTSKTIRGKKLNLIYLDRCVRNFMKN